MGAVIASNITTALAWTCFFFALTYLDPAIVNTIHSAMGPLTVVALGSAGVALAKPKPLGRVECAGYVGIAASVAALWWVVIGGYSGLPSVHPQGQRHGTRTAQRQRHIDHGEPALL